MSTDYTVRLEQVFQGPMDLLLHLVNEQEVDIQEVEITRVLDGYLAYLKALEEIDIEVAGDFLVMAATLMAIKARSLLPREEVDLDEALDPRDELIQRLIEYRHLKEVSRDLTERMDERAKLYPLGEKSPAASPDDATIDIGELTQWDLLAAFSKLMRETLAHRALKIQRDDRPLRWYVERMVGWLEGRREVTLRQLLLDAAGGEELSKATLIGSFCALLELVKLGVVGAVQESPSSEITIVPREDFEGDLLDIVRHSELADETLEESDGLTPSPADHVIVPAPRADVDLAVGDAEALAPESHG